MKQTCPRLTLVTQLGDQNIKKYIDFILSCVGSGVSAVQLREKKRTGFELLSYAHALCEALAALSIPLIINDSLALCLQTKAQGLHLGQSDGCVIEAREKLGPDKIIGLTVNSMAQIHVANSLPVDYIGVGPIFKTKNKAGAEYIWGVDGLAQAVSISKHPVVAIGGVDSTSITKVVRSGVDGIAAIGAFHDAENTQAIISAFNHAFI